MNHAALVRMLHEHEGLRLKPYRCTAGKLTIGVGHNLDDKGLPRVVVDLLLDIDIADTMEDLDNAIPWWRELDNVRQLVIADMAFNLGITGLLKFRKALQAMQHGIYDMAANEMRKSVWAKQVGRRADRLIEMMRTGVMV